MLKHTILVKTSNFYKIKNKNTLSCLIFKAAFFMHNPLVSILCPFKNEAAYLKDMIASVLEQSYTNWELFLIDDHSSDDGKAKIMTFNDPRIVYLQNTGLGIIDALKTAFMSCKGECITRMDADDLMPPYKLKRFVDVLCKDNKALVTGKVKYFSREPISEGYLKYQQWLNILVEEGNYVEQQYRECGIASANWMMSKSQCELIGYPNTSIYPEDYDMFLRVMQHQIPIKSVNVVTHLWREHPDRTSRNSKVYDQGSFFELKLMFWFQNELSKGGRIVILGYNQKTKLIKKEFEKRGIQSICIELNQEHIGKAWGQNKVLAWKDWSGESSDLVIIGVYPPLKLRLKLYQSLLDQGVQKAHVYQF